jgi:hypothetical protein
MTVDARPALYGAVWALCLIDLTTAGCDVTGAPQPIPIPDRARLRVTGLETTKPGDVHVVGLAGAVPASVEVEV